ncbi:MAG: peptidoglycan recognition protein family protein [Planctomycetota bacterium]|jgi:hypothetical protein|nr:peptidoglycan recognition protein family protein [Planctomycetota bacterium]
MRGESWRPNHKEWLIILEWTAVVLFLLAALYFLWFILFPPEPILPAPAPDEFIRLEFRQRLRAAPLPAPDPAWAVEARPDRWRGIVLHHTATEGGDPDGIDRFHRTANRWENGLGYHFLIGNGKGMNDGEVVAGRRWREQEKLPGAHVIMDDALKKSLFGAPGDSQANDFAIGVALVGNFQNALPTPAQLAALLTLLNFLRSEYNLGLTSIFGHGQVSAGKTDCPGKGLLLDEILLALANP